MEIEDSLPVLRRGSRVMLGGGGGGGMAGVSLPR